MNRELKEYDLVGYLITDSVNSNAAPSLITVGLSWSSKSKQVKVKTVTKRICH